MFTVVLAWVYLILNVIAIGMNFFSEQRFIERTTSFRVLNSIGSVWAIYLVIYLLASL